MQYFSFSSGCLAAAALVLCSSASAQVAGTLSVRLGATHISPQVSSGYLSTPSFPGTTVGVGSASTLTGGLNYMVTDHWALDLPLGLAFKHDFYGTGAIDGIGKLGQTKVVPATLFAQYLFNEPTAKFRPYIGLGVTYSRFFKNRSTAALTGVTGGTPANPTTAWIENKWGLTPQIGFVWSINERWFVDAAYYKSFLKTTTHLSSGQTIDMKLNPNIFSFAIGYRF